MMLSGATPMSSICRISLLLAQSNPVPRCANKERTTGLSLHLTAEIITKKVDQNQIFSAFNLVN